MKLNRTVEEESKYDGPQLIDPKTPYHIDYTPRFADRSLKFFPRVG
jgi:hypothetical protein